MKMTE